MAKHIKKPLRSTITSLDWHPNNILLAAGSTDYKVRIFSAYIKELEPKPSATVWGAKMPFAQMMAELSNSESGGGWVHSVSFSPDGSKVAWVAHDSSIAVAEGRLLVRRLRTDLLPLVCLAWCSPFSLVCGGHDCVPVIFHLSQDTSCSSISPGHKLERAEVTEAEVPTAGVAAMKMFQARDRTGEVCVEDYKLGTTHQNTILGVRRLDEGVFSTVGGDGRLCVWRYPNSEEDQLSDQMKNCQI